MSVNSPVLCANGDEIRIGEEYVLSSGRKVVVLNLNGWVSDIDKYCSITFNYLKSTECISWSYYRHNGVAPNTQNRYNFMSRVTPLTPRPNVTSGLRRLKELES